MKLSPLLLLAAATLALGACQKADDQPKAAAGGELLPRSASDDMLPYDTVRSQPSLSDPDAGLRDIAPRADRPQVMASGLPEDDVVVDPAPAEAVP